ncbi:MAG: hypothetical protein KA314_01940 [Chloroflexi bacterium]|nr:hypothetical protein [Chloroflexota bacterium]MBP8054570.1 hypothetical protein [Chloroflexota bacterium]
METKSTSTIVLAKQLELVQSDVCWRKGEVQIEVLYAFTSNDIQQVNISLEQNSEQNTYEIISAQEHLLRKNGSENSKCSFIIRPKRIGTIRLKFKLWLLDLGQTTHAIRTVNVLNPFGPITHSSDLQTCHGIDVLRKQSLTKVTEYLRNDQSHMVWVYAPPRFGKTVFSRQLLNNLRLSQALPVIFLDLANSDLKLRWQFFSQIAIGLHQTSDLYKKTLNNQIGVHEDDYSEHVITAHIEKLFRFDSSFALPQMLENPFYLILDGFSSLFEKEMPHSEIIDAVFELMLSLKNQVRPKPINLIVFDVLPFRKRLQMADLDLYAQNWNANLKVVRLDGLSLEETKDLVLNNFSRGFPGYMLADTEVLRTFHDYVGGHPELICIGLRSTEWLYEYNQLGKLNDIDTKG